MATWTVALNNSGKTLRYRGCPAAAFGKCRKRIGKNRFKPAQKCRLLLYEKRGWRKNSIKGDELVTDRAFLGYNLRAVFIAGFWRMIVTERKPLPAYKKAEKQYCRANRCRGAFHVAKINK